MKRRIIRIDQEKCNGCGLCAKACHEGAIAMVDGKAKLMKDEYCDGLGDCLPVCPTAAITFEEREAAPYDQAAVEANMKSKEKLECGCPGSMAKTIERPKGNDAAQSISVQSQLRQWPVQLRLVPVNAPYFDGADLLIAADCTAFACGDFHNRFMSGRVTLIGCPKLDQEGNKEKLEAILRANSIKSILVVRMEVPCCGKLVNEVKEAAENCGKVIPVQVITLPLNPA